MSNTLAQNLSMLKPGTLTVGADIGRDQNTVQLLDGQGVRVDRFDFPNSGGGYEYFLRRSRKALEAHGCSDLLVGMEPTSHLWKPFFAFLEAQRVRCVMVNAYTVHCRRQGDQIDSAKDDARDAFVIADLVRTGKFTRTQGLRGSYADLRGFSTLYHRLRREGGRKANQIDSAIGLVFPEIRQAFKNLTTPTAGALLRTCAAAVGIRTFSEDQFIAKVRGNFRGRRLMVSKLRLAHRLAATSVGLSDGAAAVQMQLRMDVDLLEGLQLQAKEAYAAMMAAFRQVPEALYAASTAGLPASLVASILGGIGDPSHFSNASQLTKLAGTQPTPCASGRKSRSRTPMSRKGRPELRTALFYAALYAVQHDIATARRYQELQTREKNPLCKMEALGVIMNRLLRVMWALMHNHTMYDPNYRPA